MRKRNKNIVLGRRIRALVKKSIYTFKDIDGIIGFSRGRLGCYARGESRIALFENNKKKSKKNGVYENLSDFEALVLFFGKTFNYFLVEEGIPFIDLSCFNKQEAIYVLEKRLFISTLGLSTKEKFDFLKAKSDLVDKDRFLVEIDEDRWASILLECGIERSKILVPKTKNGPVEGGQSQGRLFDSRPDAEVVSKEDIGQVRRLRAIEVPDEKIKEFIGVSDDFDLDSLFKKDLSPLFETSSLMRILSIITSNNWSGSKAKLIEELSLTSDQASFILDRPIQAWCKADDLDRQSNFIKGLRIQKNG